MRDSPDRGKRHSCFRTASYPWAGRHRTNQRLSAIPDQLQAMGIMPQTKPKVGAVIAQKEKLPNAAKLVQLSHPNKPNLHDLALVLTEDLPISVAQTNEHFTP